MARFNDVHPSEYNSAGSERIWMKFGALQLYCLELARTDFGRDPQRSRSGRASRIFCCVNNARLYRFPVSQISRNVHTRRGPERWWILSDNICENLPVRIFFEKKTTFAWTSSTTSDFRPRYLRNDYKSRKVMTGWRTYGMLTFHFCR